MIHSKRRSKTKRAIKALKAFAKEQMNTEDNRIDTILNQFIQSRGRSNPPKRVRVRLARKRNEDTEAADKLYTEITYVAVEDGFKGLQTQTVIAVEE
jgi:large subunit ribosomal protein L31e